MTIEIAFFNALGRLPIEIEAEIRSGIRRRDGLTLIVLASGILPVPALLPSAALEPTSRFQARWAAAI
ncbi:hypothetical protein [Bradyrhizobium sp. CCBAU 51745]|uniref:hypothetical protein n=1 Tax=Bradyrhizobium sp. CCBAU 51745 TaxID=1325099 RepID=UPI002306A88A|nr:hypothetical protein [Bradyrhizobium sp. CCBAU 51745]